MISDPTFSNVVPWETGGPAVKVTENWFVELKRVAKGAKPTIKHGEAGGLELRWEGPVRRARVWQPLDPAMVDSSAEPVDVYLSLTLRGGTPTTTEWVAFLEERDGDAQFHAQFKLYTTRIQDGVIVHGDAKDVRLEAGHSYRFCIQFSEAPVSLTLESVVVEATESDSQTTRARSPTPSWRKLPWDDMPCEHHWSAELVSSPSPSLAIEVAAAQSLAIKYLQRELRKAGRAAPSVKADRESVLKGVARTYSKHGIRQALAHLLKYLRREPSQSGGAARRSLKVNRDALLKGVARTYSQHGLRQALARVYIHAEFRNDEVAAIEEIAKLVQVEDRHAATALYRLAYDIGPSPVKAKRIAARMFQNGDVTQASRLLSHVADAGSSRLLAHLGVAHSLQSGVTIPDRRESKEKAQLDVAYVAAGTLPFLTTGYAVRTHQMLRALKQAEVSAICYARPGFPHDRPDALDATDFEGGDLTTDGVDYSYSSVGERAEDPESYIERVSDVLLQRFKSSRPAIVHAASNYMNALPALIAARRAGIPFIYEVRGLWELTAASRLPGWEATERFKLDREMEMLVAREADHVFTITRGVAEELAAGGLPPRKIALLPNAVDPDLFCPVPRDEDLAAELGIGDEFTLVYAGSLTVYEGLDDLISAVAQLRQRGIAARLIIAGDGVTRAGLERQVSQLDLAAAVTFVGRVPPDDIRRYLSLADAVALPRKAFQVCKVVSPLKPFEAMAMRKAVVLTDLPALRDIVEDGVTGLIAAPEDPDDLAETLFKLAVDPELRGRLGEAARQWVVSERSWSANAQLLKKVYADQSLQFRNVA